MNYQELLKQLEHPKKKKPLGVVNYSNDWLVQVIVENKRWTTVYFTNPPSGVPKFQARDKAEALELAWKLAYADARVWLESGVQDSDTQNTTQI